MQSGMPFGAMEKAGEKQGKSGKKPKAGKTFRFTSKKRQGSHR